MLSQLTENFRLLVAEVEKQVRDTAACLRAVDEVRIEKIHLRDDYIDNMKGIIHNRSFRLMLEHPKLNKPQVDTVRALGIATDNLENVADFCTHIADQTHFLSRLDFLTTFEPGLYFDEILPMLPVIEPAILGKDATLAFRICRCEFRLDALYKRHFQEIMRLLESGGQVPDLITSLFIIRYLERTGDALLNIGEAALSSILGEKFKIHQVSALDHAAAELAEPGDSGPQSGENPALDGDDLELHGSCLEDLEYSPMGETRSGCRIGRIRNLARRGAGNWTLFKEGSLPKISLEKKNLERWNELVPGLVPRVIGYHEQDDHAHLLLEYLQGQTFQDLLLNEDFPRVLSVLEALTQLMADLWDRTVANERANPQFTRQLQARLPDILRLHPSFDTPERGIGDLRIPAFSSQIQRLAALEQELAAPFSVFIHGDFNNDNLIVEPGERRVRFIDVNRSRQGDYLQDVTVFLLSNFRLPVFEHALRERITEVNRRMFHFAHRFANDRGDSSFEKRCALGLVRSFLTSTRFVADESFAVELYRRAVYLTDRLLDQKPKTFHFPEEILE